MHYIYTYSFVLGMREPKKKKGFHRGHLLFFRNPCRERNLLNNNNVTFIRRDMTFKNKKPNSVEGSRVQSLRTVFSGPDSKHGIRIKCNPFCFCLSLGSFIVIARPPCTLHSISS